MLMIAKGYTLLNLSAARAGREGFLEQLSEVTDTAALRCRVQEVLAAGGMAIRVTRKGRLVGVLLAERTERNAAELIAEYPELADKLPQPDEGAVAAPVKAFVLTDRIVLPEHDAGLAEVEATNDMRIELLNLLLDGETKAVLWGGKAYARSRSGQSGGSLLGMLLGASFGFGMGLAFKNAGLGIVFGVSMAMLWGVAMSHAGKGES